MILGFYWQTDGRWKKYHEPKIFRNERLILAEQLQQALRNVKHRDIRHQGEGFQSQSRQQEQWTVDLFCEIDRPQQPAIYVVFEKPG